VFIAQLIPILLAANPASLEWQEQLVNVLLEGGLLAFMGFVLLHLASFLQPKHFGLQRRLSLVRHLAVIAVLGYLLLVPMQVASTFSGMMAARAKRISYIQQSTRLSDLRESIQGATSVRDLELRLQNSFEPALTPQQTALGLYELRRSLLRVNEERQLDNTRKLKDVTVNKDLFGPLISRSLSSLGWALAFATGAVPIGMRSSLFEQLRHR
jgi:hypothetical protein